jgi:hypothetical protein
MHDNIHKTKGRYILKTNLHSYNHDNLKAHKMTECYTSGRRMPVIAAANSRKHTNKIYWDVRHFGGTNCHHLQGRRVNNQQK